MKKNKIILSIIYVFLNIIYIYLFIVFVDKPIPLTQKITQSLLPLMLVNSIAAILSAEKNGHFDFELFMLLFLIFYIIIIISPFLFFIFGIHLP